MARLCYYAKSAPIYVLAEPLPMKQRALPQSFWQEPNVTHLQAPAGGGARGLPPLCNDVTPDEDSTTTHSLALLQQQMSSSGSEVIKRDSTANRVMTGSRHVFCALFMGMIHGQQLTHATTLSHTITDIPSFSQIFQ